MYQRHLRIEPLLKHKSLFLLGPRQTGKSTLLRQSFPMARYVDLLEADTFRQLSAYPETLRQSLAPTDRLIIIDEVQKLPSLLDEVQLLIDRDASIRFILTGSSARKLRRGQANLLAGRAWTMHLHPLVSSEVEHQQLERRLSFGSLPAVLDSPLPAEDLKAYVGDYLKEEIRAEGLVRSIESFSRFLDVAGLCNGEILNYTKVGSDAGIPPRTVRDHFQVLEDTLLAYQLPAFRKGNSRKAVATAKFYFFDVGVANTLLRRGTVERRSENYGRALEHLVFLELRAFLDYNRLPLDLNYWRTHAGHEVDFLVGDVLAVEVKATGRVDDRDLRSLRTLSEMDSIARRVVVSTEAMSRRTEDGIDILPVAEFFRRLWGGDLIT